MFDCRDIIALGIKEKIIFLLLSYVELYSARLGALKQNKVELIELR